MKGERLDIPSKPYANHFSWFFVLALALVVGFVTLLLWVNASHAQDPGTQAAEKFVGWVCSNQTTVNWLLGILIVHGGASLISFGMKRLGITTAQASSASTFLINLVRVLAADGKPTPKNIAQEAGAILADPVKGPAVLADIKADPVAKQTVVAGALATSALNKP